MHAHLPHILHKFVDNFQLFCVGAWHLENLGGAGGRNPKHDGSGPAASEFRGLSRSKADSVGSLTFSKHCLSVESAGSVDMVA